MAKKIYTSADLNNMTVDNLRDLCRSLEIGGMSKKRKDIIIDTILGSQGSAAPAQTASFTSQSVQTASVPKVDSRPITNMITVMNSVAQNPTDKNSVMNTTIHVSCGASSGNFSLVGKSVGEVASKLKQILNIDRVSVGIVNGKEVNDSYVLCDGENLEFVKPSGSKGC